MEQNVLLIPTRQALVASVRVSDMSAQFIVYERVFSLGAAIGITSLRLPLVQLHAASS